MQLEAVDRKKPMLICPATVGEVKDEEILVTLDGWQGACDYWCRFDDPDIFPVGWCGLNGHPPGNKDQAPVDLLVYSLLSLFDPLQLPSQYIATCI